MDGVTSKLKALANRNVHETGVDFFAYISQKVQPGMAET